MGAAVAGADAGIDAGFGQLGALGDAMRGAIFERIARQPAAVGELAAGVPVSPPAVFEVFTTDHNDWWPRSRHIGKPDSFTAILEPRIGGRWYETGDDGTECQWGEVLVWESPRRIVMRWDLDSEWVYDRRIGTEVGVRFTTESPKRARVELEHRLLERYGDKAGLMRDILGSDHGWVGMPLAMGMLAASAPSRGEAPATAART